MQTQEYSYAVNIFERLGLELVSPYLESDLMAYLSVIPQKYKITYYAGNEINKILLRYAMIDYLPQRIIQRYYCADLSYISQNNLVNFFNHNPNYFTPESQLVQLGIIDANKYKKMVNNAQLIKRNCSTLTICILIEEWLKGGFIE